MDQNNLGQVTYHLYASDSPSVKFIVVRIQWVSTDKMFGGRCLRHCICYCCCTLVNFLHLLSPQLVEDLPKVTYGFSKSSIFPGTVFNIHKLIIRGLWMSYLSLLTSCSTLKLLFNYQNPLNLGVENILALEHETCGYRSILSDDIYHHLYYTELDSEPQEVRWFTCDHTASWRESQ